MRYFAELDNSNKVKRVIVIDSAEYAIELFGGRWVETFINQPNKNYARVGFKYNYELRNFYSENSPYTDWVLDTTDCRWKTSPEKLKIIILPDEIKPSTIITEDGKIYKFNSVDNKWNLIN